MLIVLGGWYDSLLIEDLITRRLRLHLTHDDESPGCFERYHCVSGEACLFKSALLPFGKRVKLEKNETNIGKWLTPPDTYAARFPCHFQLHVFRPTFYQYRRYQSFPYRTLRTLLPQVRLPLNYHDDICLMHLTNFMTFQDDMDLT